MLNNIKGIARSQSNKDKDALFGSGDFYASNSYPCLKDSLDKNSHKDVKGK